MSEEERTYREIWREAIAEVKAVRAEVPMLGSKEIGVRLDRILKKADEDGAIISGLVTPPAVDQTVPVFTDDTPVLPPIAKATAIEQAEDADEEAEL